MGPGLMGGGGDFRVIRKGLCEEVTFGLNSRKMGSVWN